MKPGRVVGEVWASRRVAGLAGHSLKLVAAGHEGGEERSDDSSSSALRWAGLSVATDTLDARIGQRVLVAFGSGARNVLVTGPDNRHLLCDAAIALIVDGSSADAPHSAVANPTAPTTQAENLGPGARQHPTKAG